MGNFFEDQVYDWDRFQKLARTPVQNNPQVTPPPPRGTTAFSSSLAKVSLVRVYTFQC